MIHDLNWREPNKKRAKVDPEKTPRGYLANQIRELTIENKRLRAMVDDLQIRLADSMGADPFAVIELDIMRNGTFIKNRP